MNQIAQNKTAKEEKRITSLRGQASNAITFKRVV